MVQSRPGQIVHETLSQKSLHKKGVEAHLPSNHEVLSLNSNTTT
jgi:hypothetical protein